MTESKKALVLAAGLAGVAGAATLAVAPNQASAATTGTVTYSQGATTVWQTPAFKAVKRYVVHNQALAVIGQKNVNGTVWYQIGANEWIPELYLQVSGAAPAATKTDTTATAKTFAVQATYTTGAVTIWNETSYAHPSGRYLTTDQNATAVATVQANGETWYRLSNGGYVPARFAAPAGAQKAAAAAATATKAAATVAPTTPTAPQATAPKAVTTPATAANDTASQATTTQATQANTTAAAPAPKTTPAATTTAPAATTTPAATTAPAKAAAPAQPATATPVKPTANTQAATTTLTVTYTPSVVSEWRSAAYTTLAGKYLKAGDTVTAVGTTTANGETWYHLSDGNYVSARYFGTAGTQASAAAKATTPASTTTAAKPAAQTPVAPATPAKAATTTTTPAKPAPTTSAATTPAKPTTPAAVTTPAPAPATTSTSAQIQAVINVAKAQLGKPYVWGGKGPSGFDCSGLTHYAFLNGANKEIGGWTVPQESAGTKVSIANLQPGDLVFWGSAGATYHVAIYLGGNQYINAPQPGQTVTISPISPYFAPSFGVRVL